MRVRLLGTAAGGGFPQWNCNCPNCAGVRKGTLQGKTRTQSCVALSADGRRWFLLNASPDIRVQIENFPPLLPAEGTIRGSGIEGVLLTNADLDHTLGLLVIREGKPLQIYAPQNVRQALEKGLLLETVLSSYCGTSWQIPPKEPAPLCYSDGTASGLSFAAFPVPGKPPRYRERLDTPAEGDCVGYRFIDDTSGKSLVFMPDVASFDERIQQEINNCDALLVDGTFWDENEMSQKGVGTLSAQRMAHLPLGGPGGSLAQIRNLAARKIYIHINNTNPILIEDSPERKLIEQAGVEVGWDGLELSL